MSMIAHGYYGQGLNSLGLLFLVMIIPTDSDLRPGL